MIRSRLAVEKGPFCSCCCFLLLAVILNATQPHSDLLINQQMHLFGSSGSLRIWLRFLDQNTHCRSPSLRVSTKYLPWNGLAHSTGLLSAVIPISLLVAADKL